MENEPDPSAVPSLVDTLEGWRNKCSSKASQSNDPLVPVFTKTLEAMGTVVKPGGSRTEFVRALSSMALERSNSLLFDSRRDAGVRDLTYGMMECVHRTFLELERNGWQPGWMQPTIRVKQEPREEEEREETPLFAPHVEVKRERGEEMDEDEVESVGRQQSRRTGASRSAFDIFDFGSGGEDGEDDMDSEYGSRMGRRDFSRARSLPTADGNGGGAGGVAKKRRAPAAKKGSLGCVLCDWKAGNFPGTVISHLRVKHGQTTTTSGCYFRCACGFESRSNNHYNKCADAKFTLMKDVDKPFTPKRSYSKNLPRKGKNGNN